MRKPRRTQKAASAQLPSDNSRKRRCSKKKHRPIAPAIKLRGDKWVTIAVDSSVRTDVLENPTPSDALKSFRLVPGRFDPRNRLPVNGISEISLPSPPTSVAAKNASSQFETPESASSAGMAVALLRHDLPNQQPTIGTAWVVGPRTLVTAAHNVIAAGSGASGVKNLALGYDGTTVHGGWHSPSLLRVPKSWMDEPGESNPIDFAIINLHEPLPLAEQSYFGFGHYLDTELESLNINTIGYPGAGVRDCRMKYSLGYLGQPSSWEVPYVANAGEGLSGAPVYAKYGDYRIAVAIHRGTISEGSRTWNVATRINNDVYNQIQHFIRNPD